MPKFLEEKISIPLFIICKNIYISFILIKYTNMYIYIYIYIHKHTQTHRPTTTIGTDSQFTATIDLFIT